MKRATRPILITDAPPTPEQQIRRREARYLVMMGARVACLVAAGILVSRRAPLLWVWVPLCLVGMVLLPWLAVLVANDAPPKGERTRRGGAGWTDRTGIPMGDFALPGPAMSVPDRKIIENEP